MARVDAAPSGVQRRQRRDDDPAHFLFEHAADTARAAVPSGVRQRRRGACPPPARARRRHGSGGHPIARSTATTWWACSPPTRARRRHRLGGCRSIARLTATSWGSLAPYSSTLPTLLGWTPLHRAFDSDDDVELARLLLEHAAHHPLPEQA